MRIIQIIRHLIRRVISLAYSSFYYFGLEQLANSWGSFELNSQMAPSLFQIHVLSTLTMSSFALEAREECTGHENPRFFKVAARPRSRNCSMAPSFRSDFSQVNTHLSSFSRFWTSVIEIELVNEDDCSLLSMLYCLSLQKHIFLAFCNYFESHCRIFAYILLKSKTLLVLR